MTSIREQNSKFDFLAKFVILGDSGVGKTNILIRYTDNQFKVNHLATIGIDYKIKKIQIDGKIIKMQMWDTAGQQRFRTLTQSYYKGASGIVLVYAVNDRKSFQNIANWVSQISMYNDQTLPKILVGNKCDLQQGTRIISQSEGRTLANTLKIPFLQVSAKQGTNIQEIFNTLGRRYLQQQYKKRPSMIKSSIDIKQAKLQQKDVNKKKIKKQCC